MDALLAGVEVASAKGYTYAVEKNLSALLSALSGAGVEYSVCLPDGKTPAALFDCAVRGLSFDSRDVREGFLFFALPGTHTSGSRFVRDAVLAGASAVVFEGSFTDDEVRGAESALSARSAPCAFVRVPSARYAMSPVSAAFYDAPSSRLVVFGVTGTEGKSSTVYFIWQMLRALDIRAGFISTVQYSLGGDAIDNRVHQTTPEAPIVQRELYEMAQNGCTHAVVEASSHGLSRRTNRLGDVLFDCAAFMNVTLEHLEFHGTYEQYKSDKANLFRALDGDGRVKRVAGEERRVRSAGVVNLDDKAALYFRDATGARVIGFCEREESCAEGVPCALIRRVASDAESVKFDFTPFGDAFGDDAGKAFHVDAPVAGAFNARNITAAILCVNAMTGASFARLAECASRLAGVRGRMTRVDCGQDFEVIVDYAHTPSSFETILPPLRARCRRGRIIAVFGSGGERDVTKRPLQGEAAARYCDIVVLTDEDPRGEDREKILRDIAAGALRGGKIEGRDLLLIPDRPQAIMRAFSLARAGDIVLLLGKSHENSIIYADRVMPYDEIGEARAALAELLAAGGGSKDAV